MFTALKAILFTVVVPGAVAVYGPYRVLASYPDRWGGPAGVFRAAGVGCFILGAAIYFWCLWDFAVAGRGTPAPIDPPRELVVRGLYRFCRNPMYIGVLSVILAQALFFRAPAVVAYAAIVFGSFAATVVFYEEPALSRKFGSAYARYCAQTPRWLPKVRQVLR